MLTAYSSASTAKPANKAGRLVSRFSLRILEQICQLNDGPPVSNMLNPYILASEGNPVNNSTGRLVKPLLWRSLEQGRQLAERQRTC